jgi:hypothetical protein
MSTPTNANLHVLLTGEVNGLDDVVFGGDLHDQIRITLRLYLIPPRGASRLLIVRISAMNYRSRNALL